MVTERDLDTTQHDLPAVTPTSASGIFQRKGVRVLHTVRGSLRDEIEQDDMSGTLTRRVTTLSSLSRLFTTRTRRSVPEPGRDSTA